jgi:transposase
VRVESVPDDAAGLRAANARLRAVVEAKDAEITALRAERDTDREVIWRLGLRLAELERRLGMDSSDSGIPWSRERIGAKEARRARQQSQRERRRDRRPGGQPGHQGKGLQRDPDPGERKDVPPAAECRACGAGLGGADTAGEPRWAQVIDVEAVRTVTEWLLPGLSCPCCGTVTFADPPAGACAGAVSCGPALNAAAVVLTASGNVPPERAARLIGMLLGPDVSAGWVDKASARLSARLGTAGFDEAMLASLALEKVLAADETPVTVLDRAALPAAPAEEADPEEGRPAAPGSPHVMIVRTPDERLTFLQAMTSRRKDAIAGALPAPFAGTLITDGHAGYQHLLGKLAGIQQCCAHVNRRCRAVAKLGPGRLQSWAEDVITILRDAHLGVEAARARGDTALEPEVPGEFRHRYDEAAAFGIIHNRLRDWDAGGNHPGYALGCWLRDYKEQVFLFTRDFNVDWTTNVAERGAKAAKRHQAVSGYWHKSRCPDSCHYAEAEVMPRLAWQPWPGHRAQGSDQHIFAGSLI